MPVALSFKDLQIILPAMISCVNLVLVSANGLFYYYVCTYLFEDDDTNSKQSGNYLKKCQALPTEVSFIILLSTPYKIPQHCYTDNPANTIPQSLVLLKQTKTSIVSGGDQNQAPGNDLCQPCLSVIQFVFIS